MSKSETSEPETSEPETSNSQAGCSEAGEPGVSLLATSTSGTSEPSAGDAGLAAGAIIEGRWRVIRDMGRTTRGVAYRVAALEGGRTARLELWERRHVQERGRLAQFEREARILSRLRHGRCLCLLDFGVHEGQPFIVSELLGGRRLREELGTPEMTLERALMIGLQVLEGLRHLHAHGVVHRELGPDSIMVSTSSLGSDLVTMGPARLLGTETGPGEVLYQPPERSAGKTDHRGDLYVAGMLLYVMTVGREPPLDGAAPESGRAALVPSLRGLAPERGIGERLERVILRALASSPDARFQSADELIVALEAAAGRRVETNPAPAASRTRSAVAVAAMTIVGVTAIIVMALPGGRSARTRQPTAAPAAGSQPAPPVDTTSEPPAAVAPSSSMPAQPSTVVAVPSSMPVQPLAVAAARAVVPIPPAPAVVAAPAAAPARPAASVPPPTVAATSQTPVSEQVPPASPEAPAGRATGTTREQDEIWSLLDRRRLDAAAVRISRLIAQDPQAAWPHLARGDLYYQRFWRRDTVEEWELAVTRDPQLRHDPRFAGRVCTTLDAKWEAAGIMRLVTALGDDAVPLLRRCLASAKKPRLRAGASRALDRLATGGGGGGAR